MKNSQEILNELMTISPLLAAQDKINVFSVPEGYFEELQFRIANYVILNTTTVVENINKRNFQDVPAGYFDTLSDLILAKVNAATSENAGEELRNLSPLLYSLKDKNVFTVPENYFDNLSDSILYNTGDAENAEAELRILSPMLYSLKGENIFTVPVGYFESLTASVTQKLMPVPAKVISMKKRTSWLKYAAAAVVAGIITITSLQVFKGTSHNNSSVYASLPAYFNASFQYKTEAEINAGIAKLDDADIAKYLEKNGNVMDNELLINNTDVSEMPSPADYLIDDNTLNEYLDKIDNINGSN
ncbi:MAG TPA: hypothetical protein VNS50_08185 [Ginsengibacter sp.]|nr:hypothetical protein [Ginsengibacter sp.]